MGVARCRWLCPIALLAAICIALVAHVTTAAYVRAAAAPTAPVGAVDKVVAAGELHSPPATRESANEVDAGAADDLSDDVDAVDWTAKDKDDDGALADRLPTVSRSTRMDALAEAEAAAAEAVDAFHSSHRLVVRALGGMEPTLRRFKTSPSRRAAVIDVRRALGRRGWTVANYQDTIFAVEQLMTLLSVSGVCSTFYHNVPDASQWVVACWSGPLKTYSDAASFVVPHVLLGWPEPARTADARWDYVTLRPLPLAGRGHSLGGGAMVLPVDEAIAIKSAKAARKVADKAADKAAKKLAKARRKVAKKFAMAVQAAQAMRKAADKAVAAVKLSEKAEDEWSKTLKESMKCVEEAKEQANKWIEAADERAKDIRDAAKHATPAKRAKREAVAAAVIARAAVRAANLVAPAIAAHDAVVASVAAERKASLAAALEVANAGREAAYTAALAIEADARVAMDLAVAAIERAAVAMAYLPMSSGTTVGTAAAATAAMVVPVAARTDANEESMDLGAFGGDAFFESQYGAAGLTEPFDTALCQGAIDSGDLCIYMCCQTRLLGAAECGATSFCW